MPDDGAVLIHAHVLVFGRPHGVAHDGARPRQVEGLEHAVHVLSARHREFRGHPVSASEQVGRGHVTLIARLQQVGSQKGALRLVFLPQLAHDGQKIGG